MTAYSKPVQDELTAALKALEERKRETAPTPTLVEDIYRLQSRAPLASDPASYAACGVDALEIATRHEQAWHAERQRLTEELTALRSALAALAEAPTPAREEGQ